MFASALNRCEPHRLQMLCPHLSQLSKRQLFASATAVKGLSWGEAGVLLADIACIPRRSSTAVVFLGSLLPIKSQTTTA